MGAFKQEMIEAESRFPLGYDIHAAQGDVKDTLEKIAEAYEIVHQLREAKGLSLEMTAALGTLGQALVGAKFRALDADCHLARAVRDADRIKGL